MGEDFLDVSTRVLLGIFFLAMCFFIFKSFVIVDNSIKMSDMDNARVESLDYEVYLDGNKVDKESVDLTSSYYSLKIDDVNKKIILTKRYPRNTSIIPIPIY